MAGLQYDEEDDRQKAKEYIVASLYCLDMDELGVEEIREDPSKNFPRYLQGLGINVKAEVVRTKPKVWKWREPFVDLILSIFELRKRRRRRQ